MPRNPPKLSPVKIHPRTGDMARGPKLTFLVMVKKIGKFFHFVFFREQNKIGKEIR